MWGMIGWQHWQYQRQQQQQAQEHAAQRSSIASQSSSWWLNHGLELITQAHCAGFGWLRAPTTVIVVL